MAKTFVQIGFALVGNYEDGSEGLRVEATFGLLYAVDWKDEPTQEVVDEFGRAVGVNNAWPYWREFVQSMTARMGLPPVRIPILRMDQLTFTRSQQTKENAIVAVSKPKKKIAPKSVKKR